MTSKSGQRPGYKIATTAEEVLRRYRAGERVFTGADLPDGSSFRGMTLSGAQFTDAWLFDADFTNAVLRDASFEAANVKCASFQFAQLQGASFQDALLCGANFFGAAIENTRTQGATWCGASVTDLRDLQTEPVPSVTPRR